jgi:hypothetical protein
MPRPDKPNETTNTMAGINTPASREDNAATDPIAGAVAGIMDNLQHAWEGASGQRSNKDHHE